MTTSTSIDPDDQCTVCGTTRDMHGDKQHGFTTDPEAPFLAVKPGPEPRNTPPQSRASARPTAPAGVELARDPVARLQLRLTERLVSKGLLNGEDLMYIFGADLENH